MLTELTIRNFAIIEELTMSLASGFNVLTGETGAGKSIILDSLGLILGSKPDKSMIRAGATGASVEALFELDPMRQNLVNPLLETEGLEGEVPYELTLVREVRANGRTIARVNGRSVSNAILQQLGEVLVDIHGQGEHLSLLKPKSHLGLLDGFADINDLKQRMAHEVSTLKNLQSELAQLQESERGLAEKVTLFTAYVEEIDTLELTEGEEDSLKAERIRLGNAEQLGLICQEAASALSESAPDQESVSDQLSKAQKALGQLSGLDQSQLELSERLNELIFGLDEVSAELSAYQEELEYNPTRLNEVEGRIEDIAGLKRKHNVTTIPEILSKRDQMALQLTSIENRSAQISNLQSQISDYLHKVGKIAADLSARRQTAANELGNQVEAELIALGMTARFHTQIDQTESDTGAFVGEKRYAFDATGIDKVEFLMSANPGEPLRPIAKVASGGETARLMLALKTALARVDATPTLIFDEIDQGIGARLGHTVGSKLWALSILGGHQVIVVTHLAQLAGYGDRHFHVRKQIDTENNRTATQLYELEGYNRIEELADMIGKGEDMDAEYHSQGMASTIIEEANKLKEELRGSLTC